MQPLAYLAKEQGYFVSGSDSALGSESSKKLAEKGIHVMACTQTNPAELQSYDIVVYSSAIPKKHPEYEAANRLAAKPESRLQMLHRMEFLNMCMDPCRRSFAVGGTHGKTSSTAMLAWLLLECGLNPYIFTGGRPFFLTQGARLGKDPIGVYETDESDGSFLKSKADLRLLLNIDRDHLEHYGSMGKLCEAFYEFWRAADLCAVCLGDAHIKRLLDAKQTKAYRAELEAKSVFFSCFQDKKTMEDFVQSRAHLCHYSGYFPFAKERNGSKRNDILEIFYYDKETQGNYLGALKLQVPGQHFAGNALGVLALADAASKKAYVKLPACKGAGDLISKLQSFPGVERRLSKIGSYKGTPVYDDYGHHPKEIQSALQALRAMLRQGQGLLAIFQPHRYTRTAALSKEFAQALSLADRVFLLPIYGAGEKALESVSSQCILDAMRELSKKTPCSLLEADDITEALEKAAATDMVGMIVGFGAGSISCMLKKALAAQ